MIEFQEELVERLYRKMISMIDEGTGKTVRSKNPAKSPQRTKRIFNRRSFQHIANARTGKFEQALREGSRSRADPLYVVRRTT